MKEMLEKEMVLAGRNYRPGSRRGRREYWDELGGEVEHEPTAKKDRKARNIWAFLFLEKGEKRDAVGVFGD